MPILSGHLCNLISDEPETPVMNGNLQHPGLNRQGMPINQNMVGMNGMNGMQFPRPTVQFGGQIPQRQSFSNQQFQFPNGVQMQGQWPSHLGQGQPGTNQHFNHIQFPQNAQNINPALRNAQEFANQLHNNQVPGSVAPAVQGQIQQGRRRRHTDPDCKRLKDDPDTYCRTYESLCHNCTLEKRLRFEGRFLFIPKQIQFKCICRYVTK